MDSFCKVLFDNVLIPAILDGMSERPLLHRLDLRSRLRSLCLDAQREVLLPIRRECVPYTSTQAVPFLH